MYIRVLCTIIYQSDDLALSASDTMFFVKVDEMCERASERAREDGKDSTFLCGS